jgi:hypothetical protein
MGDSESDLDLVRVMGYLHDILPVMIKYLPMSVIILLSYILHRKCQMVDPRPMYVIECVPTSTITVLEASE